MFFVLAQVREHGHTYDNNVRMGGWKNRERAIAAAVKRSNDRPSEPCVVKDHTRNILGMADKGRFIHA